MISKLGHDEDVRDTEQTITIHHPKGILIKDAKETQLEFDWYINHPDHLNYHNHY